jgi:hypothetical protein
MPLVRCIVAYQNAKLDGIPNIIVANKGLLFQKSQTNWELKENQDIIWANIPKDIPIKMFLFIINAS